MYPIAVIILGIVIVALILIALNFRFLLYPFVPSLNPTRNATRESLNGPSVFISDLHLRADHPFQHSQAIRQVMEARRVSNLIVVGDLFDSPKDGRRIAEDDAGSPIADILGVRGLPIKAFFIQGSRPHDPSPKEDAVLNMAPLVRLGRCALLDFNRMTVIAYHGHDLSWKGAIGHGWDRFISQLSLERAWKRLAGVPDSNWVIFGHTHIPGIDVKHRVANCGGWQSIRFLVHPACTGLFLSPENGSLEIVNFVQ
jgi:predicted phosphodiesterase